MSRTFRANLLFLLWTGLAVLFAQLLGGEVMGRIPLVAFAPLAISLSMLAAAVTFFPQDVSRDALGKEG